MSQWQPIETAPKDGAWVLTYDDKAADLDDIEETTCIGKYDESRGRWTILLDGQVFRPTHWMPLPEPPK